MSEDSILNSKAESELGSELKVSSETGRENILIGIKVVSGKDRDVSYTY